MFHYIQYIAYLKKKDKIDYTGVESFVWDHYINKNLEWFPVFQSKKNHHSFIQL